MRGCLIRAVVALMLFGLCADQSLAQAPATQQASEATLAALMPDMPGFYNLQFRAKIGEKAITFPCRVYLPKGYEKGNDPWPLVVFLHSEKERGADLAAVANVGPERALRQDENFRNAFKMISLTPQCPADASWDDAQMASSVSALVEQARKSFRVDADRVYLAGAAMGGTGVWRAALEAPDRFAAVAVNSAKPVAPDQASQRLRHLPAYIVASAADKEAQTGYAAMVEAIKNGLGDAQFAQLGNTREECIASFFSAPATYEWLLKQKRRTPKERQDRDAAIAKAEKDELANLPRTPGNHKLQFATWVGAEQVTMPYLLYLPKGYDKGDALCPTLLFLHGMGEADRNLQGMFVHGPGFELNKSEKFRDWYPFINVCPAYEAGQPQNYAALTRSMIAANRLLDHVAKRFRVDPDRVYASGLSIGGTCTWLAAFEAPDRFAAIAPISGRAVAPEITAQKLKYVSTWIINGANDGDFTNSAKVMAAALSAAKVDVQYTTIPGGDHGVWIRNYGDQRFYEWLLRHRRLTPEERKQRDQSGPPILAAAPPQTAGEHRVAFSTTIGDKTINLPYTLYLPPEYEKRQDRLPVVLYLHDLADRGTDLAWQFSYGLSEKDRSAFPMVAIAPQCPVDRQWEQPEMVKAVLALLDNVSQKLRIDPDRVSVVATNTAGAGLWTLVHETPERFAALAAIGAPAVRPEQIAAKHKYLSAWISAIGNENGVADQARKMADALTRAKAQVQLALVADPNQVAWRPYHTDPKLTEWLLKQHRPTPEERRVRDERDAYEELVGIPREPGLHKKQFEFKAGDKIVLKLPYLLYVPKTYFQNQERYPTALFLHDADARGADLAAVLTWGPFSHVTKNARFRDAFRMLSIAPQCPAGLTWDDPQIAAAVSALVDHIGKSMRVDVDRLFLIAHGAGVPAAWQMAMASPERFIGLGAVSPPALNTEGLVKIKYIVTWVQAAQNEKPGIDAAKKLVDSLRGVGAEVAFEPPEKGPADKWAAFYGELRFYDWLWNHRRPSAIDRRNREERDQPFITEIPTKPGHYKLKYVATVNGQKVEVPYLVYLPRGYDESAAKWPALVFLHGAGEGAPDLSGMFIHGPPAHLQQDDSMRQWYPYINICPIHDNSPERAKLAVAAVDEAIRKFRVDADRVYLTGFSLGGTSTWTVAQAGPDRFAAIAPICARANNPATAGEKLKYVPAWVCVGSADGDFHAGSQQMTESLRKAGGDVLLTVLPGRDHGIWPTYYSDRRFYEWFRTYKRMNAEDRARRDRNESLPLVEAANNRAVMQTQVGGKVVAMPYGLYLPKGYEQSKDRKWPMMVLLHHENDKISGLGTVFNWGSDVDARTDEKSRFAFPMVGLAPQCPADKPWTDAEVLKRVLALIDEVGKKVRVDEDRIYVTGVGNSGTAAWALVGEAPERFAAIAPFFLPAMPRPDQLAPRLRYVATRLVVPGGDSGQIAIARQTASMLRKSRGQVYLAMYDGDPNRPAWPYHTEPALCQWLLEQRRPTAQERKDREDRDVRDALAKIPSTSGQHNLQFETVVGGKPCVLSYRLYLPKGYEKASERFPMLLFLHGANAAWSPDQNLAKNEKLRDAYPLITVSPQCPADRTWSDPEIVKALVALTDDVCRKFRVDEERLYASGLSAGTSIWQIAVEAPDRFAAIAPASAAAMRSDQAADRLKRVAAWIIAGSDEAAGADAARQMAELLRKAQAEVELTLIPRSAPETWQAFYDDPKFSQWLLRHKRR